MLKLKSVIGVVICMDISLLPSVCLELTAQSLSNADFLHLIYTQHFLAVVFKPRFSWILHTVCSQVIHIADYLNQGSRVSFLQTCTSVNCICPVLSYTQVDSDSNSSDSPRTGTVYDVFRVPGLTFAHIRHS